MGDFRMPSLGADMDVGTIIEWLVKPGDAVMRGQIVAVVDTAKAAIEIESFEDGVVEEIIVRPGLQVPVGTTLARLGPVTAPVVGPSALARSAGVHPREGRAVESGRSGAGIDSPSVTPRRMQPQATPPVRHLAHQLGIDLDTLTGTGREGQITHGDVVQAAPPAPAAPPAARGRTAPPAPPAARGITAPPAPPAAVPGRPRGIRAPAGPAAARARPRATPRARKLATELGIDLSSVTGSGYAGAVLGHDIERAVAVEGAAAGDAPSAAPRPTPSAAAGARSTAAGLPSTPAGPDRRAAMRAAIAKLMSRSNAEIPHYYVTHTIDLATALAWLRDHNANLPAQRRVLPAALFLRATVLAAIAVPDLNGHWLDGALHPADQVDLGVAVGTRGGGLVTPAISGAGELVIDDLMVRLTDLVARARRGNLRQVEMAGATITVSNLGESGPEALHGVIFPPQVALVGVGGIHERPWAVQGMLTVRPTVTIVLAADHRASDGRTASAFLAALARALDHPEEL